MTLCSRICISILFLINGIIADEDLIKDSENKESAKAEVVPTVSLPNLRIDLLKEGFHKSLEYQLEAHEEGCYFIIKQKLPAAVYVDPDELYELVTRRKYNITYPDFIDVEKPAEKAHEIILLIHHDEDQGIISIPIHFRYHNPAEEEFEYVEIPKAVLFKNCPSEIAPVKSECFHETHNMDNKCGWEEIQDLILKPDFMPVKIPRGNKSLGSFITFVTILISWIGCAVIIMRISKKKQELTKKLN